MVLAGRPGHHTHHKDCYQWTSLKPSRSQRAWLSCSRCVPLVVAGGALVVAGGALVVAGGEVVVAGGRFIVGSGGWVVDGGAENHTNKLCMK